MILLQRVLLAADEAYFDVMGVQECRLPEEKLCYGPLVTLRWLEQSLQRPG